MKVLCQWDVARAELEEEDGVASGEGVGEVDVRSLEKAGIVLGRARMAGGTFPLFFVVALPCRVQSLLHR
jgi:hypothetical protein